MTPLCFFRLTVLSSVCLAGASCGPKESALVVNVRGWPSPSIPLKQLRVLTMFEGTPGKTLSVKPSVSKFTVYVPANKKGRLVLEGMVQAENGCYVAGQQVVQNFEGSSSAEIEEQDLDLIPYDQVPQNCAEQVTEDLTKIWQDRPDNAWAVGTNGTIIRWDGDTWTRIPSNTPKQINCISGDRLGVGVWSVGFNGLVLRWSGSKWEAITPPPPAPDSMPPSTNEFTGVWSSGIDNVWVVGNRAILHWDGIQWTRGTHPDVYFNFVWGIDDKNIWATGSNYSIYKYAGRELSGKAETTSTISGVFNFIWGTGPDDIWAVGSKIMHRDGNAWTDVIYPATSSSFRSIWGSSSNDITIVSSEGDILKRKPDGWDVTKVQAQFNSIWGSDVNHVWAVGKGGDIFCRGGNQEWQKWPSDLCTVPKS